MTPSQTASPAASSTGSSTGDDDVAAILTESARRFFSEACPPALLRRAETDPDPDVGPALWRALDELGLPQACAPETAGGSGLGWAAVRGVIESCGEHGVPVALPEMLAAHLVARTAGLAVPAISRITLAVARREVRFGIVGRANVRSPPLEHSAAEACALGVRLAWGGRGTTF